jgi:glycosidase
MDGWRLDVVHMLGEAGGARNNLQHVAGITRSAKAASRKRSSLASTLATRASGCRTMRKMRR